MSLKKTAIIITVITLASKLLGFFRELILANYYGTSYIVDSYLMALSIPVIALVFLYQISYSITPIYLDTKVKQGTDKSNKFISDMVKIVLVLSFISLIVFYLFTDEIVSLCAPGFDIKAHDLTAKFLKISIWVQIITSLSQIFINYLNSNDRFISASLATISVSSIQIVFIILSVLFSNNMLLIWGNIVSNLVYLLCLMLCSKKIGLKLRYKFSIDENIKKAMVMVLPIIFTNGITQINIFIDKWFASGLQEGSISALNYANTLKTFMYTIFSIAITTIIYPVLSKAVAEDNMERIKSIFIKGINYVIIIFIPITVGAILLSKPAIVFVFQRGKFDAISASMTIVAFIMYSIGLLFIALRDVSTKVFYSIQDTKSTLIVGVLAVGLNIILNIILVKYMQHAGLALATSLSAIFSTPLFLILLRKKFGRLGLVNSAMLFIKSCISSAIMGALVYLVYNFSNLYLGDGRIAILFSIGVSVIIGGIAYFISMILMKVKEMDFFTDIIKKTFIKLKR